MTNLWKARQDLARAEEAIEQAKTIIDNIEKYSMKKAESKKETRKDVIEKAKNYVRESKVQEILTESGTPTVVPEFIVKRAERVVVVLLRGYGSGAIYRRGVAKTAPEDVFNVHIGKAIALKKALEQPIPDELMFAPKPEKAEVGNKVMVNRNPNGRMYGEVIELTERVRRHDNSPHNYGRAFFHDHQIEGWLGEKQFEIVDDSKGAE